MACSLIFIMSTIVLLSTVSANDVLPPNEIPNEDPNFCKYDCCPLIGGNPACPSDCTSKPYVCNAATFRLSNGTCAPIEDCFELNWIGLRSNSEDDGQLFLAVYYKLFQSLFKRFEITLKN